MELEQLRQLDAIVRKGTITEAAASLFMSQSALSRSMQRLEEDLGVALFDRSHNRVELNDAGRLAVEYGREVLRAERRMRDGIDDYARRQRVLRVGTCAPAPLWSLTALVVERFSGTLFAPETMDSDEVRRRLIEGSLDFALTLGPIELPNVRTQRFMTENLGVSVMASDPLAFQPSVGFSELDGGTYLLFSNIGFWADVLHRRMPGARYVVHDDRIVFEQMVRSSELPHFVTDSPLVSANEPVGRVTVPVDDEEAHAVYYLSIPAEANPTAARVFDWLLGR